MYKRIIRFSLVFSIISGIIGFLLYLVSLTGIFTPQAIDYKYCYIYNNTDNEANRVFLSFKKKNGYRVHDYYYSGKYKSSVLAMQVSDRIAIPYDVKAEILSYTEDSILAKIRIKWEVDHTPFTYHKVGYVPTLTLHNTIAFLAKDD